MRKHNGKNSEGSAGTEAMDVYPDISAIFDIDEDSIPSVPAEKAQVPQKGDRILTSPDGIRHLPKAEQKKLKAEERKARRAKTMKKAKTRAIIFLAILLVALIAALVIWLKIEDAKKPLVAVTSAAMETLDKTYTANAVITTGNGTKAVLIDNDYDVHALAKGQPATIVTDPENVLSATVSEIREMRPSDERFAWLTTILLGNVPEVPMYTVSLSVEDPGQVLKEGDAVTADIITATAENAVVIPSSAVFTDGPQPYVWIYHSFTKKLSRQDISVGISTEEKTEVMRGLKKGVKVVSGSSVPSAELYDGVRVKMKASEIFSDESGRNTRININAKGCLRCSRN